MQESVREMESRWEEATLTLNSPSIEKTKHFSRDIKKENKSEPKLNRIQESVREMEVTWEDAILILTFPSINKTNKNNFPRY